MSRHINCYLTCRITEVYDNKECFLTVFAQESVLFVFVHLPAVQVHIHQVEEFTFADSLFFLADMQDGFVSFTQLLLLFTEQMRIPAPAVTPAVNAVYVPIVEDGGSSVLSAETLAVHSLFAQFLSEINHDWIASQAGRYDEGRNSLERIAGKEVGCNALLIVVFQEIQHVVLNIVHALPAMGNSGG